MMDEEHPLYRSNVCPRCDETIEDDPVSYVEPIEIEGFGVVHGWCAEEIVEEALYGAVGIGLLVLWRRISMRLQRARIVEGKI